MCSCCQHFRRHAVACSRQINRQFESWSISLASHAASPVRATRLSAARRCSCTSFLRSYATRPECATRANEARFQPASARSSQTTNSEIRYCVYESRRNEIAGINRVPLKCDDRATFEHPVVQLFQHIVSLDLADVAKFRHLPGKLPACIDTT